MGYCMGFVRVIRIPFVGDLLYIYIYIYRERERER